MSIFTHQDFGAQQVKQQDWRIEFPGEDGMHMR